MSWLKKLFYKPNQGNEKVTDDALAHSIIVSVIGILVCIVFLVGLTWAWFSDSAASNTTRIEAANFDLIITVNQSEQLTDGFKALNPENEYEFSFISQNAETTASSGFYKVSLLQDGAAAASVYYTENISKDSEFVFFVSGFIGIELIPMWGEVPSLVTDTYIIRNNSMVSPVDSEDDTDSEESDAPNNQKDEKSSAATEGSDSEQTSSGKTESGDKPDSEQTSSDQTEPGDKPDSEQTSSDQTEPDDKPDSEQTSSDQTEPGDKPDSEQTSSDQTEPGDKPDSEQTSSDQTEPDGEPDSEQTSSDQTEPGDKPDSEQTSSDQTEPDGEPGKDSVSSDSKEKTNAKETTQNTSSDSSAETT